MSETLFIDTAAVNQLFVTSPPPSNVFELRVSGNPIVTVNFDGTVDLHGNTVDEASKAFWDAVSRQIK